MKTVEGGMNQGSDPVVEELLRIYMDFHIMHDSLLQQAALAQNADPLVEAATGVAQCIVRVMSSLYARGYEFPN